MKKLTLGSLFDGSGSFPLAGMLHGITPLWASEIEPYPIAVSKFHFPKMKHIGSVTEIDGGKIEPVDIITFGSPCQDLSVAGKQAGIHDGQRSNLFFEAIRIIKEMRHATAANINTRPRFAVWENVPGAFSSGHGDDFRCVLEALANVVGNGVSIPRPKKWEHAGNIIGDGWSIAWRLLDAQYWGVPQRRKRIYLIADFGSERAGEILFERESVSGNNQSSAKTGETVAGNATESTGRSDCYAIDAVVTTGGNCTAQGECYYADKTPSIKTCHPHAVCFACDAMSSNSMKSTNPHSGFHEETVSKTLQATGTDPTCNQGGNIIVECMEGQMCGTDSETGYTLQSGRSDAQHIPTVCYCLQGNGIDRSLTAGCNGCGWRQGECYTLNTIDIPAVAYDARGNGGVM